MAEQCTVTCNVCGKTILKDGKFKFCGHWRGESYKDQVCYWGAKDIEYHEVSTVNNPADDFAQIMKVTVVTDSDDKKDSKEDNKMAETNTDNKNAENVKNTICDMIDQLLGNNAASTSDSSNNDDNTEDSSVANADNNNDAGKTDDSVNEELNQIKQQLADANEKVSKLEKELGETKDALAKNKEDLAAAQTEANDMKEKCMTLATANKELVADSIIAKEMASNSLAEENKDSRKEELLSKSMKELNELQKENKADDNKQVREPAQVTNPTLANPDKDTNDNNGSADVNKKPTDNNNAKKTVDDFAKDIVGKLLK